MGTASTVGCDHLMLYIAILATDKFQELNIFRIWAHGIIGFNIPFDTLLVILETILPAIHFSGENLRCISITWRSTLFELVTFYSFSTQVCNLRILSVCAAYKRMIPVIFEKDDDDNGHIDFIAAASVCY